MGIKLDFDLFSEKVKLQRKLRKSGKLEYSLIFNDMKLDMTIPDNVYHFDDDSDVLKNIDEFVFKVLSKELYKKYLKGVK